MFFTYIYDGTYMGFLTVVYDIISSANTEYNKLIIVPKSKYQPTFLENVIEVKTSKQKSYELYKKILSLSDKQVCKKIYYSFLSDMKNKEIYVYKYIVLVLNHGKKIKYLYHDSVVNLIEKACKNVSREIGKYMGLLRFSEVDNNLFYAQFEPTNDIIVPISHFFKERLKSVKWIIHDVKRNKMCIYDFKRLRFCKNVNITLKFSNHEHLYQTLWKSYFKTMAIEERKNYKLQRQNMPKKYWKYLIEKN